MRYVNKICGSSSGVLIEEFDFSLFWGFLIFPLEEFCADNGVFGGHLLINLLQLRLFFFLFKAGY